MGGKVCGEGGGPVVRMVWGEFARGGRPQGKPPQAASAARGRRLRRSRSALRAHIPRLAGVPKQKGNRKLWF